ncbi:MAG: addiction module protein [Nannocystaceae bacterium]
MTAHDLLGAVLELPTKDRARIARRLLQSLDERDEETYKDDELLAELDQRREQALRGEVRMLSREEFTTAISKRRSSR